MTRLGVWNEFGALTELIVSEPMPRALGDPICDVQRHFQENDPPHLEQLMPEYAAWIQVLQDQGVVCHRLPPESELPHQIFTRDIAMVVGERCFLGRMQRPVRQPEPTVLSQWLTDAGIPFEELLHGTIEGGDVIVHHPFVFVGLSQRTDRAGLSALRDRLDAEWEVVPIPLAPSVLHLDCVFAILGPARMLWCPSLITDGHDRLREIFHERLEVTQEQVLHMAANVLLINPTTVCVEQRQHILKLDLEALGFTVHVVDWRETKKLGGLFRCASAPLQRLA